jgi:hypothetical protein
MLGQVLSAAGMWESPVNFTNPPVDQTVWMSGSLCCSCRPKVTPVHSRLGASAYHLPLATIDFLLPVISKSGRDLNLCPAMV